MSHNPSGGSFEIPQDVLDKLGTVLNGEDFSRIGFFLAQESPNPQNYIRLLKAVIGNDESFRNCANRLADDTKRFKDNPDYLRFMSDIWNNYMKPHLLTDGPNGQEFNYQLIISDQLRLNSIGTYSFLSTLARLPSAARLNVIRTTVAISERFMPASATAIGQSTDILIQSCQGTTGQVVTVSLVAVYLSLKVFMSIKKWWKGEISGERCWKNIIDSSVEVAAGVGGSFLGASIGSALLPGVGTVVGGVVGSWVAADIGKATSDFCTQKIFNVPKDVALENAYRYLSLSCNASNHEINEAFRRLALQYHPDKGGNYEDWHKLQFSMAAIKVSKEDAI